MIKPSQQRSHANLVHRERHQPRRASVETGVFVEATAVSRDSSVHTRTTRMPADFIRASPNLSNARPTPRRWKSGCVPEGSGSDRLHLGEVPDLVRRPHFEPHHSGLKEPLWRAADGVLALCRRARTGPAGQGSEGSSPLVPSQIASRRRTNKSTSCGSSPSRSADT